jgi:hypothetical protein
LDPEFHVSQDGDRAQVLHLIRARFGGCGYITSNSAVIQNPQRLYAGQGSALKIQSELHGDMQSQAEMTWPPVLWHRE